MDQAHPTTKASLLQLIEQENAALRKLVATIDAPRLEHPPVYDTLSVKDILAHLAAWEALAVGWITTSLGGKTPLRFAPGFELQPNQDVADVLDRLNAHLASRAASASVHQVLADWATAHAAIVSLIELLPEADLFDIHRFTWWDGEPIITLIAANSYDHYHEHRLMIELWLAAP
ncbi:MAG: hypothetical protein NVSMB42_08360 [Herpetosiphon sp.]